MFNPFLNRETGLHAIGEPEKSVKVEFPPFDDIHLIRTHIRALMDFGAKKGVQAICGLEGAEDSDNIEFINTVAGLERYWQRLVVEKFDQQVVPPKQPADHPCVHFIESRVLKEAFMNAIEHGFETYMQTKEDVVANYLGCARFNRGAELSEEEKAAIIKEAEDAYDREPWTRTVDSPAIIEAHSSSKGIFWIVEQQHGGEKFLKKVEPILQNMPLKNNDLTYRNKSGRRRGAGLTNFFDASRLDQVSYEFVPPHGLKVFVLKQFTGDHQHDVEFNH